MWIHSEILRQITQHRPQRIGRANNVAIVPQDASFARPRHRGQNAHQRGLPRAIRAKQSQHAGAKLQTQVAQAPHSSRVLLTYAVNHQLHGKLLTSGAPQALRGKNLAGIRVGVRESFDYFRLGTGASNFASVTSKIRTGSVKPLARMSGSGFKVTVPSSSVATACDTSICP